MRGDRIKQLRTAKKLTQEELGKIINVTKVSISGYENGNRTPDTDTLKKIADFFEVSTDYLLGRQENTPPALADESEFDKWLNDPRVDKFYKEFKESPEERKKALLAVWEIIKKQEK